MSLTPCSNRDSRDNRGNLGSSFPATKPDDCPTLTLTFRNADGYDETIGVVWTQDVKFTNDKLVVGEDFRRSFDFSAQISSKVTVLADVNSAFQELGLNCQVNQYYQRLVISGTPRKEYVGNFRVRIVKPNGESSQHESPLVIRAPQSLWQENNPPKDAPYPTPNVQEDSGVINTKKRLTVLAASVRGRSHAHEGKFRDDYFQFKICQTATGVQDPFGWHVFTVSDGAGSARYSRKGAQIVCESFTGVVSRTLNSPDGFGKELTKSVLREINNRQANGILSTSEFSTQDVEQFRLDQFWYAVVDDAQKKIADEVDAQNRQIERRNAYSRTQEAKVSARDFSATALCVAIKRFKSDSYPTWCVLTYWVGDGAIVVYRPGYSYPVEPDNLASTAKLLGAPDGGEYAGETKFITSHSENNPKSTLARARMIVVRNFEALLMATDGVTDPFFETPNALESSEKLLDFWKTDFREYFPGALDASLSPEERAEELRKGLMFQKRGYHDDRTLLLVLNDAVVDVEKRSIAKDSKR